MALETRHTEKQLLFNMHMAMMRDDNLRNSREYKNLVTSLETVMEPEDVALVEKKIKELDENIKF